MGRVHAGPPGGTIKHVAIIYNPNSTGDGKKNARELAEALGASKRHQVELIETKYAGHAKKLACDLARKYDYPIIISASGDGGYNEVVNGVMEAVANGSSSVCAVLPSGNANDHDRAVGELPLCDAILTTEPTLIDLLLLTATAPDGSVQTCYAHSYIGLGLTPVVAVELNRHSLTAIKEASVVVTSLMKFRPFTITAGGKQLVLDSLIMSNIDSMAKVFKLSQESAVDDGIFEINAFPHRHKLWLLAKLLRGATFGLEPTRSVKEYEFTVSKAMPIQLDGEVMKLARDTQVKVTSEYQVLKTYA